MTKQEFENALRRSVEAMLDGGQHGIDDILLIGKALGGVDIELMDKYERDTYLFGVHAGYILGIGKSWHARPNANQTKERCNCKRLSDSANESQTKAGEYQTKAKRNMNMSDYPERYEMALEITREVFQKQTPVKPIYDHRYGELGCAYCGNLVSVWEETPNYCPNCGQAIDWSEE